jgi:hypothetical protein
VPRLHVEQAGRGDVLVELVNAHPRVEDVADEHGAVEPLHHPPQDGGLARADLAGDDDQPLPALNPVVQVRHRLRVRRREVDEARVGRQRERQFFETVEVEIHHSISERRES